jgi:hypothetical protein
MRRHHMVASAAASLLALAGCTTYEGPGGAGEGVLYWLVNSSTTEGSRNGDLHARHRAWNDGHGDAQMFPRRPRRWPQGTS